MADSGASSNVGKYGCGLTLTGERSYKIFNTVTGEQAAAKEKGRWEHSALIHGHEA